MIDFYTDGRALYIPSLWYRVILYFSGYYDSRVVTYDRKAFTKLAAAGNNQNQ